MPSAVTTISLRARLRAPLSMSAALAAALTFSIVGCGPTEAPLKTTTGHDADGGGPDSHDAGHGDHDHGDHDHSGHNHAEMGIHGGHVVVLDPGHIHAEWVHNDDDNIIEVYVIDKPEDATKVQITTKIKDQEPTTVELARDEALGNGGYKVENPNLLTNIQMADGEAITVTLEVETSNGTISAQLTDDHGHDHDHGDHDHGDH